ncbi:MAG: hypothetical protein GZ094_24310, partial [Mariniphaga sp.]|nr:hypothetical protein [Mariniphaga sp.]
MKVAFVKYGTLTLALFFVFFSKGFSIGDDTPIGAREVSLGNASVALISPFSAFHNQAALARIKSITVAVDYRQPYLIEGFASAALTFVIPTPVSNFAISLQQKGFPGYHESRFGCSMARTMGKRVSAGIQFNYFMIDFPEQGSSRGTFLIEFGLLFQTTNQLTIGLHIFNPSRASIESLNLKSNLPVRGTAGIALKPSANLVFVSALAYCVDCPLNVRMGIEYQFSDCFFLRGGLSGKPIRHSAGLGYKNRNFGIDFAIVHHETLGYTP